MFLQQFDFHLDSLHFNVLSRSNALFNPGVRRFIVRNVKNSRSPDRVRLDLLPSVFEIDVVQLHMYKPRNLVEAFWLALFSQKNLPPKLLIRAGDEIGIITGYITV